MLAELCSSHPRVMHVSTFNLSELLHTIVVVGALILASLLLKRGVFHRLWMAVDLWTLVHHSALSAFVVRITLFPHPITFMLLRVRICCSVNQNIALYRVLVPTQAATRRQRFPRWRTRTPTGMHTKQRKQLMVTVWAQGVTSSQGTCLEFGDNAGRSPTLQLDQGGCLLALETRVEFTCGTWLNVASSSMAAVASTGWIYEK